MVIVASSLVAGRGPEDDGMGPAVALQLWTKGQAAIELDAWPGEDGRWQPHVHLGWIAELKAEWRSVGVPDPHVGGRGRGVAVRG